MNYARSTIRNSIHDNYGIVYLETYERVESSIDVVKLDVE